MQVETADRPGLLYVISRVLADRHDVNILPATTIDTEGYDARVGLGVVDTFRLEKDGRALSVIEQRRLGQDLQWLLGQPVIEGWMLKPGEAGATLEPERPQEPARKQQPAPETLGRWIEQARLFEQQEQWTEAHSQAAQRVLTEFQRVLEPFGFPLVIREGLPAVEGFHWVDGQYRFELSQTVFELLVEAVQAKRMARDGRSLLELYVELVTDWAHGADVAEPEEIVTLWEEANARYRIEQGHEAGAVRDARGGWGWTILGWTAAFFVAMTAAAGAVEADEVVAAARARGLLIVLVAIPLLALLVSQLERLQHGRAERDSRVGTSEDPHPWITWGLSAAAQCMIPMLAVFLLGYAFLGSLELMLGLALMAWAFTTLEVIVVIMKWWIDRRSGGNGDAPAATRATVRREPSASKVVVIDLQFPEQLSALLAQVPSFLAGIGRHLTALERTWLRPFLTSHTWQTWVLGMLGGVLLAPSLAEGVVQLVASTPTVSAGLLGGGPMAVMALGGAGLAGWFAGRWRWLRSLQRTEWGVPVERDLQGRLRRLNSLATALRSI